MQNKTEKQSIWNLFKSIPYLTMNKYVQSHDNTANFQTMYSRAWFVAFVVMGVVSLICFKVDYEVLFGIEYTSSLDEKQSFWSAIGSATIIQFLIVFCGGMFFKIIIFGKLRKATEDDQSFLESIDKKHVFQCLILGTLFVYGFSWTIDLSNKTYFSAKANAIGNKNAMEYAYKADATLLSNERQSKIENLQRSANETIESKKEHYTSLIASVVAKYEAKKGKVSADYAKGKYTKAAMERHLHSYDAKAETEKAALLIKKEKAIAPLQIALAATLADIRSEYTTYEKSLDYKASNNRSELNAEIEATAKETQGRNVTYNLVNVILMIGLLFFAKDSLHDTAPTGSDEDEQNDVHIPSNTAHSSTENTNSNSGHTTDTQHAKYSKKEPKKTQKESVVTAKHSKTQHEVGDYIEFDDLEENTEEKEVFFEQDSYEFKRKDGVVFIKHGKTFGTLANLNTWWATYNKRVDKYTKEHKHNLATKNAKMAALIGQKINYMKQNFVYATTENQQKGFMRSA